MSAALRKALGEAPGAKKRPSLAIALMGGDEGDESPAAAEDKAKGSEARAVFDALQTKDFTSFERALEEYVHMCITKVEADEGDGEETTEHDGDLYLDGAFRLGAGDGDSYS